MNSAHSFGAPSASIKKKVIRVLWHAVVPVFVALGCGLEAQAQGLQNYYEDGGLVRGNAKPKALGNDAFGEKIDGYTRNFSFNQLDISLPGNSAIAVEVRRSLMTGFMSIINDPVETDRSFGDWELDVPSIRTYAPLDTGWTLLVQGAKTAPENARRCAYFGTELYPVVTQDGMVDPGFPVVQLQGVGGAGEILISAGTYPTPSSGGPYGALTAGGWQFSCIAVAGPTGQSGEGFLGIDPQGTKYQFDWLVRRQVSDAYRLKTVAGGTAVVAPSPAAQRNARNPAAKPTGPDPTPNIAITGGMSVPRAEYRLMPTLVTDRFGNWVRYNWNTSTPWRLNTITSSDGRTLTFTYTGPRITSVSDGTRTWTYGYEAGTAPDVAASKLKTVTLPDNSQWQFSGSSLQYASATSEAICTSYNNNTYGAPRPSKVMIHPSGLRGEFVLQSQTGPFTVGFCQNQWGQPSGRTLFYGLTLATKTLSGPGLPTSTWTYGNYSSSTDTASYIVTDPRGFQTRHTYGIAYGGNEGKLIKVEEGWNSSSSTALRATAYGYHSSQGQTYAANFGYSSDIGGNGQATALNTPVDQVQITQQGTTFTRQTTSFDALARPTNVTRSGPGGSRTESTSYADNTSLWVMGQVDRVVASNGDVMVDNDYNTSTAQLSAVRRYGILQTSYTYNTDGTLASKADGASNTTTYGSYKRGLPQSVGYPTGASESAVVNDLGLITSVTDAAGYTTSYGYDTLGRLASITPPTGFTGTSIVMQPVTTSEYGLPAGHWRQAVTKGNAVTNTYLDALWRPVMTRTYDATSESTTRKVIVQQFDIDGRTSYQSYPVRDASAYNSTPGGVTTSYDALGRPTQSLADSELGTLTTSTSYLTSFQTQTTNPRGKVTAQSFWALDDPAKASLAGITAPAGVNVSISRDVYGKPTAITRSGTYAGYTSSVTRSYVYDAGQRLCKTIEPEVGSTVQVYDAASNISWKAPGQNLPSTTSCDDTSVPAAAHITYSYDALNRLLNTSYGDGSSTVSRTYTSDGLLWTIASNGGTWNYGYNALRKLATESFSYSGQTYNFSWSYDSAGNISSLTYPDRTVNYSPNALGEITGVSGYASGISYFPNGAVAGYTLANGIVHSLTQNTRGLPLVNRDAGVIQDQYAYDANANVTGITDQQENVFSRSMGYDDLDRLTSANATGVWGSATYAYDPVDNLRTATVGTRSTVMNFGSNNQLASITSNGSTANYGFDARGNLTAKGPQTFGFDLGNRLTTSSLGGSYAYDGHGRRFRIASSDGSTRMQLYSQGGQLLWATSTGGTRPTSTTAYVYLAAKQIAETNSVSGTQYVHTDALGSPVAHTNTSGVVVNRSRFEPYGYVAAGTKPSANTSVIGFTGHVQDAETDLVYMHQRYYDPIAGRFLSVDPVVTDANTGKGFGLYTYVDNNPYAKVDPDGRAGVLAVGIPLAIGAIAHQVMPGKAERERDIANGLRAVGNAIKNVLKSEGEAKPDAPKGDKPSTLTPGPNAGDSIPARGPGRDFTPEERGQVNDIGNSTGCHTCGATDPGTKSGNWVPDHQPPSSQNPSGGEQRLYPHCLNCSRTQGGEARQAPKPEAKKKED